MLDEITELKYQKIEQLENQYKEKYRIFEEMEQEVRDLRRKIESDMKSFSNDILQDIKEFVENKINHKLDFDKQSNHLSIARDVIYFVTTARNSTYKHNGFLHTGISLEISIKQENRYRERYFELNEYGYDIKKYYDEVFKYLNNNSFEYIKQEFQNG